MPEKILWLLAGVAGIVLLVAALRQEPDQVEKTGQALEPSPSLQGPIRVEVLNGCGVPQIAARLTRKARALGLAVHPVEERVPVLLHGPLAAEQLRRDCGVDDPDVLEAVRWHSIACAGMGEVGLVVFLADKLEPGKAGASSYLRRAAELAQESLDEAVWYCLTAEMGRLLERGGLLHPSSVEARNDLIMRLGAGDR